MKTKNKLHSQEDYSSVNFNKMEHQNDLLN